MPNDQDQIDSHIYGKIDARERKQPETGEGQFYLRGYYEEKQRMESAAYCRNRNLPIHVSGYRAGSGGSCVACG